MTESVSFKAYLKRDGQEVEVRRFGIDSGAATNFTYLCSKIQTMFPSVQNDQFKVFWQDIDKDYISISSDEELLEALTSMSVQPFKIYIQVESQKQQQAPEGNSSKPLHSGVTCDGCQGAVTGFRYKCVTCPDFDLCAACEASGLHQEHFMLRMPAPVPSSFCHPKIFRKFLGRQHKFHKRHGWNRTTEATSGDPHFTGLGRCAFSRRDGPGVMNVAPDMFDFSSLLEFINNLGIPTARGAEANEPTVSAQASTSAQATSSTQTTSSTQAQATSSQPTSSQPTSSQDHSQNASSQQSDQSFTGQSQSGPNATEYLNGIGEAIAAFLDPFGVDVTFDVRTKPMETKKTPPSTQTSPVIIPTASAEPTATATAADAAAASTSSVNHVTPAATVSPTVNITVSRESTPARRNSDDWTLINRESPTRNDDVVVMDVDGVQPKIATVYPELPKETPSAPPQTEPVTTDNERQRIQEAVENIRSMGFDFETSILRELLRRENCDIATVLEMILNNSGKK